MVQSRLADRRPGVSQAAHLLISELGRYLKCENCGERGHDLTIVWADR